MAFNQQRHRNTFAQINLRNLGHNVKQIQQHLNPGQFFCPMVKANAYGHGDVEVSRALQGFGVQHLGVGLVEEGVNLRMNGISCDIIFFGLFDDRSWKAIRDHHLTPVISSKEQLEILESLPSDQKLHVHLKFDTGMHRLGFRPEEAALLAARLEQKPNVEVVGVMTHLFNGEDTESKSGESRKQISLLSLTLERGYWPRAQVHILNSAGFIGALRSQDPMLRSLGVRPGLMIYGVSPMKPQEGDPHLKSVMSLRSSVARIHRLRKGQTVSYGGTWKAVRDSVIGVLPIGYADGYHRALSNRGEVLIKGELAPVIGNVCMDYLMIDLTRIGESLQISPENFVLEEVTLLGADSTGKEISAAEVAQKANTISWEVLTSVGERVPRTYCEEESVGWNLAKTEAHV